MVGNLSEQYYVRNSEKSMKVMIIGADGQLGSDLVRVFSEKTDWHLIPLTIQDLDITNVEKSKWTIQTYHPDVIVNTAGYIQVDLCETHVEQAFQVNAFAQKHMSEFCRTSQIKYCLFSTDYVFDGKKTIPYKESDPPRPMSMYGVSKLAGEQIVQYMMEQYLIVRVSGLYGTTSPIGKKGNFIEMILERAKKDETLRVVDDQILTPTFTLDVANQMVTLLSSDETGIFHMTNQGSCSWYDFASQILKKCGLQNEILRAKTGDFRELAHRPSFSVLENDRLSRLNMDEMAEWQCALHRYLILKGHCVE